MLNEWLESQKNLNEKLLDTIRYYSESLPSLEPNNRVSNVKTKRNLKNKSIKSITSSNTSIANKIHNKSNKSNKINQKIQPSDIKQKNDDFTFINEWELTETKEHNERILSGDKWEVDSTIKTSFSNRSIDESFDKSLKDRVSDDFQWLFLNKMDWKTQKLFLDDFIIEELGLRMALPQKHKNDPLVSTNEISLFYDKYKMESRDFHLSFLSQVDSSSDDRLRLSFVSKFYQFYYVNIPNLIYSKQLSGLDSSHLSIYVIYQMYISRLLHTSNNSLDIEFNIDKKFMNTNRNQEQEIITSLNIKNHEQYNVTHFRNHDKLSNINNIKNDTLVFDKIHQQNLIINYLKNLKFPLYIPNIVPPLLVEEVQISNVLQSLKLFTPTIKPKIFNWINDLSFRKQMITKIVRYYKDTNTARLPILVKRNNKYILIHGIRWRGCDTDDQNSFLDSKFKRLGLYQGENGYLEGEVFNSYPYFHADTGKACISSNQNQIYDQQDYINIIQDVPDISQNRVWSLYPLNKDENQISVDRYDSIRDLDESISQMFEFISKKPDLVLKSVLDERIKGPIAIRNQKVNHLRRLNIFRNIQFLNQSSNHSKLSIQEFLHLHNQNVKTDLNYVSKFEKFLKLYDSKNFIQSFSNFRQLTTSFHPYHLEFSHLQELLIEYFPFISNYIKFNGKDAIKNILEILFVLKSTFSNYYIQDEDNNDFNYLSINKKWFISNEQNNSSSTIDDLLDSIMKRIRKTMFLKFHSQKLASLFFTGLFDPNSPQMNEAFSSSLIKNLLLKYPELSPIISRSLSIPLQDSLFILNRAPPTTTQVITHLYLSFDKYFKNIEKINNTSIEGKSSNFHNQLYFEEGNLYSSIITIISKFLNIDSKKLVVMDLFPSIITFILSEYLNNSMNTTSDQNILKAIQQLLPKFMRSNGQYKKWENEEIFQLSNNLLNSGLVLKDENETYFSMISFRKENNSKYNKITRKLIKYWNIHWNDICKSEFKKLGDLQSSNIFVSNLQNINIKNISLNIHSPKIDAFNFFYQRSKSPLEYNNLLKTLSNITITSLFQSINDKSKNQNNLNYGSFPSLNNLISHEPNFWDILIPGLTDNNIGFFQLGLNLENAKHPKILNTMIFASESEIEYINSKSLLENPFQRFPIDDWISIPATLENRNMIAEELINKNSISTMISTKIEEYNKDIVSTNNLSQSPIIPNYDKSILNYNPKRYLQYCQSQICLKNIEKFQASFCEKHEIISSLEKLLDLIEKDSEFEKSIIEIKNKLISPVFKKEYLTSLIEELNLFIIKYEEDEVDNDFMSFILEENNISDSSSGVYNPLSFLNEKSNSDIDKDFQFQNSIHIQESDDDKEDFISYHSNNSSDFNPYQEYCQKLNEIWDSFNNQLQFNESMLQSYENGSHDLDILKLNIWYTFLSKLSWDHLKEYIPSPKVTQIEKLLNQFTLIRNQSKIPNIELILKNNMFNFKELFNSEQEQIKNISKDSNNEPNLHSNISSNSLNESLNYNNEIFQSLTQFSKKTNWIPHRTNTPEESYAGGHCDFLIQILDEFNDEDSSKLLDIEKLRTLPTLNTCKIDLENEDINSKKSSCIDEQHFGWMDLDAFVGTGCSFGEGVWIEKNGATFKYNLSKSLQENFQDNTQLFQYSLNALQLPQNFSNSTSKGIPNSVYDLNFIFLEEFE